MGQPLRAFRLENAGTDKNRFRAEPHAERRIGGGRDAARREIRDGKLTGLCDYLHELHRRTELFRLVD